MLGRKILFKIIILCFLNFCSFYFVLKCEASAWVRRKGESFYSIFISNYKAKKYFDKKGNKKTMLDEYKKKLLSFYFEEGITDDVTLTLKAPYAFIDQGIIRNEGFEEVEIGFIHNIKRLKNESYSRYFNLILPSRISDNDDIMPLSYGKPGIELGFSYGTNYKNGYLDSGLGYRYYKGYPASQIRTYIARSSKVENDLHFFLLLDSQIGLNDGKDKIISRNILLDTNYKLVQIYVGPQIRHRGYTINIGYQKVLWGRNTGIGEAIYASGWYSF